MSIIHCQLSIYLYLCRMKKEERKILYYEDYFINFFYSLDEAVRKKVAYVLDVLKTQSRISTKFVKFVRDGLYELRIEYNSNIYRAFFIFDEGNVVVLFHGFQKKTQKLPEEEIEKALKLKREYYASKI